MAMSWSEASLDAAADSAAIVTERDTVFSIYFCGTDGSLVNPRTLIEYMHAWTCGVDLPRRQPPPPPSASASTTSSAFSSFVADTGAINIPSSPSSIPLNADADADAASRGSSPVVASRAHRDPRKHAATHHYKLAFDGIYFHV